MRTGCFGLFRVSDNKRIDDPAQSQEDDDIITALHSNVNANNINNNNSSIINSNVLPNRSHYHRSKRRKGFGSRMSMHSLLSNSGYSGSFLKEGNNRSKSFSTHELEKQNWELCSTGNACDESSSERESISGWRECPLCFIQKPFEVFPYVSCCKHRSCYSCLSQYLKLEIMESRVSISCPECSELFHPSDIYSILRDEPHLIEKWEEFSVRRVLMADPDTRWCPAPDCNYAVIATGCAGCPVLHCERLNCNTYFCYHCKQEWHPNQTCDEARSQRGSFTPSPVHIDLTLQPGDIKACPRCQVKIVKMKDGSCNHIVCAICGAEFCWLCMKEISDLHYLSPSGCTFWGKKPWSRKKKLIWQLGTLVGAPVGIALIAGLAVPAIIFGVPVWVGRKVHFRMKQSTRSRRNAAIAGSVVATVLLSPVLASIAVGVGVPIMLAYVYGVVPLSLCRNGTCGVSTSASGVRLDVDDDILAMTSQLDTAGISSFRAERSALLASHDTDKHDTNTLTGISLHSGAGISMHSGSTIHTKLQIHAEVFPYRHRLSIESGAISLGERINYEEASTKCLAGSTIYDDKSFRDADGAAAETKSVCGKSNCSEDASLKALAGSICDNKSLRLMQDAHQQQQDNEISRSTCAAEYFASKSVSFRELNDSMDQPGPSHGATVPYHLVSSSLLPRRSRHPSGSSVEPLDTVDEIEGNCSSSVYDSRTMVAICHECQHSLEANDPEATRPEGIEQRRRSSKLEELVDEVSLVLSRHKLLLRKTRSVSMLDDNEQQFNISHGSRKPLRVALCHSTDMPGISHCNSPKPRSNQHRFKQSTNKFIKPNWFQPRKVLHISTSYSSLPDVVESRSLLSYSLSRLSQLKK